MAVVLVVWWLLAAATSADYFAVADGVVRSWFGKLVFLGKLSVNLQSQVYYNVVKPDDGPDWQLRFQLQLLLPLPGSR